MDKVLDNERFARLNQKWLGQDVDGWAGDDTLDAWRDRTGFDGDETPSPWPVPDERSLIAFYGEPGPSRLVMIDLPYPMRLAWDHDSLVLRTQCHELVADSLREILAAILEHFGSLAAVQEARMDLYGGCYNKRPQRNGRAWSLHAWGAAIDLDPKANANLWPWPERATMPVEVIEIFEARGWKSGARAWGRDAMHFQATR